MRVHVYITAVMDYARLVTKVLDHSSAENFILLFLVELVSVSAVSLMYRLKREEIERKIIIEMRPPLSAVKAYAEIKWTYNEEKPDEPRTRALCEFIKMLYHTACLKFINEFCLVYCAYDLSVWVFSRMARTSLKNQKPDGTSKQAVGEGCLRDPCRQKKRHANENDGREGIGVIQTSYYFVVVMIELKGSESSTV